MFLLCFPRFESTLWNCAPVIKYKQMQANMSEEAIKNSLFRIGLEENRYSSEQFKQTFQKSQYLPSKSYSFREISDWSNRCRIEQNKLLPSASQEQLENELEYSKFSFLISKRHRLQRESSEGSKNKKFLELSPINVKFHSQRKATLKKEQSVSSPKKSTEQGGSFYDSHYEPLSLLYQLRRKERRPVKKNHMQEQLPFMLPPSNQLKLPKTERVSSIMRLMKKNQQIKVYRQRWNCRERFDLIKLP